MSYASEKRWENLWYFPTDLMKLYRKVPTNPAKVKAVQDRKVRELMKIAYGIPFYRERFEATGTTPEDYTCAEDLYKFPVLTKEELRDWSNLELDEYPEKYKDWHISPTSGSTGVPLRTPFSPKENAWNKANFMRSIMLAGFKPGIHKCLHRPNSLHTATGGKKSWTQQLIDTRWKDMSDAIKQRVPSRILLQEINDYKPDYLYIHKNIMVRVCLYAKRNRLYLHKPKWYSPISEMLDPSSEALLKEMLGPGLINPYGLSETSTVAVRLPGEEFFRVNSDTHVVNILDDDGNPADNGVAVVTPLYKTDFPLINYVTGDRMESRMVDGLRQITNIKGRMNDVIHHKDGSVTEWGNLEVVVNYAVGLGMAQSRFIQESYDTIRIQAVKDPFCHMSTAEIEQKYTAVFAPVLNNEFHFVYEWMDEIPSDPNGKLRMIVNNLPEEAKKVVER